MNFPMSQPKEAPPPAPEKRLLMNLPLAVLKLARICDEDYTRYALGNVMLSVADGKCAAVATDGRQMAVLEWDDDVENREVLIPAEVLRNIERDQSPKVLSINVCELFADGTRIAFSPTVGRFPRWQDCVPTVSPTRDFNATFMRNMASIAAAVANVPHRRMTIDIGHEARIDARNDDGVHFIGVIMPLSED